MRTGIIVASARPEGVFDGVGDFSAGLARALSASGVETGVVTAGEPDGFAALEPASGRHVIVNYVPQHFTGSSAAAAGRWMAQARADGGRAVLVVHEYLPPRDTMRRRLVATLLARRLRGLVAQASDVVVTHGVARDELAALGLATSAHVIPVGSNVPVESVSNPREAVRFVLFGQPAAFAPALVRAAAADLSPEGPLVWMTRSDDEARAWCHRERIDADRLDIRAGRPAEDISAVMASALVALAPIIDGVSTRRTSVAAALAHGLPVAGTDGPCTSAVLRESAAFSLCAVTDATAFVDHARRAAADAGVRAAKAAAAHELYDTLFAWPRIADAYRQLLEAR